MNKQCSRIRSAMLASVLVWAPAGTRANTAAPGPARIAMVGTVVVE